jgi:hypothetical protein
MTTGPNVDKVFVVTKSAAASFSSPQELGGFAYFPKVVVLADGTVVAAWSGAPAVGLAAGAAGSPLVPEPMPMEGTTPSLDGLVADAAGNVYVVWEQGDGTAQMSIDYAIRPPGGPVGSAQLVGQRSRGSTESLQEFSGVRVAVDPAGDLAVAWEVDLDSTANQYSAVDQVAVRHAGGSFLDSQTVGTATGEGSGITGFEAPVGSWDGVSAAPVFEPDRSLEVLWGDGAAGSACNIEQEVGTLVGGYVLGPATKVASGDAVSAVPLTGGGVASLTSSVYASYQPYTACPDAGALESLTFPSAGGSPVAGPQLSPGPLSYAGDSLVADASGDAVASWCDALSPGACNGSAPAGYAVYDASPPTIGAPSIPAHVTAGVPASLSAGGTDTFSGVSGVSWAFGDGQSAAGASVTHTWTSPGTYSVVVSATDGAGNTGHAAAVNVVVAPPTPQLSNVSESHKRWAEGGDNATIAAAKKLPVGTTFGFRLSTEANLKLTFTQKHTCTPGKHKHKCSKTVTAGTLAFANTAAGAHSISFDGRLSKRKKLKAGSYAMTLTASNSAGHASSKQLTFTIVGQQGRH